MATSTTDDGFHEIQLNGKQLVFLFMAVTVVSVVIFLCGVLVGRGVRTEASPAEQLIAQEAAPAPAAGQPPPPAVATGSEPSPASNEKISYPDRLGKAEPARERLQQDPPTSPATARPPERVAAKPTTGVSSEPAGPGFAIQLAALGKRNEADGIARRLTGKGYPAYVITPDSGAPAVFRVRVGKFKDRKEAESIAARLQKEEQFNPWIVP